MPTPAPRHTRRSALRRRDPRRARPRAARGGRAPARAHVRAGRGRHRQDPGHHPPDRLRRALRRLPAAAGARRDLHGPGRRRDAHPAARPRRRRRAGPHLPRRRAAPAALLLAAGDRRRRARGDEPQGRGRRPGRRVAAARPRPRPHRHPRPRRRDRVGQGLHAHPGDVCRGAAVPRAASRPASTRPAMARVLEAYEEVKTERGVIDFEDVLLLTVGILAERDDIARAVRAQYRHFVVDEYQDVNAAAAAAARPVAGGARRPLRRGRPGQTIYSFTGASPRAPARASTRAHPQGPGRPAGAQLPLDAPDRRAGQPRACAGPSGADAQQRACSCRPRAADGPSPALTAHPDDPAEAAARRRRDRRAGGRRASPRPRSPCCSAPTASPRPSSRRWPSASIPYLVRGGERFFARREVRDAILLLRGARPLRRRVQAAARAGPRRPRSGRAGPGRRPDAGGAGPRAVGVAGRAGRPGRRPRGGRRPRRGCPTSSASSTSAPRPSTHRPSRASPWPRCTRPRAWSGTPCSSPAVSDGYLPITMAETPEAIEEERRLLYVGVTRARRELRLSWSGARTPGARASRRPSRFLDGAASILGDGRPVAPKRRGAKVRPRKGASRSSRPCPHTAARCGTELTTAAQRKTGRCDTCPPTYAEATFERLRDVATGRRARGQRAGIRRLHRRHPHGDRRARAHLRGRAGPDLGRRGAQARALRRAGAGPHRRRRRRSRPRNRSAATESDD